MNLLGVLLCIGVSLAALAALAATDPKRRRAFRMPALAAAPDRRLLWTLALVPGILAPLFDGGAGFVLWFGATTVAGWGLAALSPARTERLAERLAALQSRLAPRRLTPRAPRLGAAARQEALELRLAELEAEVATLRRRLGGEPPALLPAPQPEPAAALGDGAKLVARRLA